MQDAVGSILNFAKNNKVVRTFRGGFGILKSENGLASIICSSINKHLTPTVYNNWQNQKEGEMPPIFKALATITAWSLFIFGWVWLIIALVMAAIDRVLCVPGAPPTWPYFAGWGLSVLTLFLAVIVMKLRQMLE